MVTIFYKGSAAFKDLITSPLWLSLTTIQKQKNLNKYILCAFAGENKVYKV